MRNGSLSCLHKRLPISILGTCITPLLFSHRFALAVEKAMLIYSSIGSLCEPVGTPKADAEGHSSLTFVPVVNLWVYANWNTTPCSTHPCTASDPVGTSLKAGLFNYFAPMYR